MLVVDQASLNKVMVDPSYKFKSIRFNFNQVTGGLPVKNRFVAMLTSDPAHIMPNERGVHIGHLLNALMDIHEEDGDGKYPQSQRDDLMKNVYGSFDQNRILVLKNKYGIVNTQKQIDPIVGKKTVRALDYILYRNGM